MKIVEGFVVRDEQQVEESKKELTSAQQEHKSISNWFDKNYRSSSDPYRTRRI